MKNEIDNKQILAVYERIQQRGETTEEGKLYQGVTAFSDIDGYTVYLQAVACYYALDFIIPTI